ncbi:hypothetical protein [Luteibacter sp.]|uniref:hypothetical protein n=1 Tax=Luteibacter sp. TaxID=1886636 RepID=UPI002F4077B5
MKFQRLAAVLVIGAAGIDASAACKRDGSLSNSHADKPSNESPRLHVGEPVWPSNGIAERQLGNGKETWPENIIVEYTNEAWNVWAIVSPVRGPSNAIEFFSGRVDDVMVTNPGGYNDSFIDSKCIKHSANTDRSFHFKDPRPGGAVGSIHVNVDVLRFECENLCGPDIYVSELHNDSGGVLWRKVPFFLDEGELDSMIGTGIDMRDGTVIFIGGKYVFRVRQRDFTPVGGAPHLRVVDERDVIRVIDKANGKDIKDFDAYLTEELHLK